jgi:hypothetical protein
MPAECTAASCRLSNENEKQDAKVSPHRQLVLHFLLQLLFVLLLPPVCCVRLTSRNAAEFRDLAHRHPAGAQLVEPRAQGRNRLQRCLQAHQIQRARADWKEGQANMQTQSEKASERMLQLLLLELRDAPLCPALFSETDAARRTCLCDLHDGPSFFAACVMRAA